ncbi:MAG: sugar transferase [Candidatus Omnitrophota bacterium]
MKRFFDLICSFAGILVLAPLMLAVALVIKRTSRGPVSFMQGRAGL